MKHGGAWLESGNKRIISNDHDRVCGCALRKHRKR